MDGAGEQPQAKRQRLADGEGEPQAPGGAGDGAGAAAEGGAQPAAAGAPSELQQQQQQQQQQPQQQPTDQQQQQQQQERPAGQQEPQPPQPPQPVPTWRTPQAGLAPAPAGGTVGAYSQREDHLMRQEAAGDIEFAYVLNDGSPTNMMRLMGLKGIFSKQLPNMPREYICRLLLNRRHRSCALVSRGGTVLGGITWRVFAQQGFGEIAFCAVAASQQVRGFGTRLMNATKALARDVDGLHFFLTYADNNAVGYFAKQGFTREITLRREAWLGYIKDYDGGTLMECVIHPKVPYADLVSLFKVQRDYLDGQIRQYSNSHVVHAGIVRARQPLGPPPHARHADMAVPLDPLALPGVKEAGWTPPGQPGYRLVLRDHSVVEPTPAHLHTYMGELLSHLVSLDESWPFRAPVDPVEALDYYDIIADPVDLSLIGARLGSGAYYVSLEMIVADVRKMCDNCRYYNAQTTPYYACAVKVQAALEAFLDRTVVDGAGGG
ncbi:GCN5 [Scenedesmus sp. PABB004]|nr:GCN5 [Scenedesmus sp. PABB004]